MFKNDKVNKKLCIDRFLRVIKYYVYFVSSIVIQGARTLFLFLSAY